MEMEIEIILKLFIFGVLIPLFIFLCVITIINEITFCNGLTSSEVIIPIYANKTFIDIGIEYKFNGEQCKGTMKYKSLLRAELYEILIKKIQEDNISNLITNKEKTIIELSNELSEPNIEILDIRIV